uniref:Uncharacterized protein n=1 Tax=Salarias fasciatus TaxID=181472 RepID=A0A672FMQ1_SALFA
MEMRTSASPGAVGRLYFLGRGGCVPFFTTAVPGLFSIVAAAGRNPVSVAVVGQQRAAGPPRGLTAPRPLGKHILAAFGCA